MIVEVETREALYRGMRGLCIRIARQLNSAPTAAAGYADRSQAVVLDSFKRPRAALCYVIRKRATPLLPARRLGEVRALHRTLQLGPGRYFDGWRDVRVHPPSGLDPPVVPPEGYALRSGWRRHGLIGLHEIPARAASDRARRRRARA